MSTVDSISRATTGGRDHRPALRLTVLGSGDAFASGGRLQAAFHIENAEGAACLIDCGATVLIGLARAGLDANRIGAIVVSHLHGDHFAGLVFFLLHASHMTRRSEPLTILGPPGTEARLAAVMEALYPGSTVKDCGFPVSFEVLHAGGLRELGSFTVLSFEVEHPSGAPSFALRVANGDRLIAYSGDTQWTESLIGTAAGADLFIVECSSFASDIPHHLSWRRLSGELHRITAGVILLTHMGPDTLAHAWEIKNERVHLAEDGLVIDL